MSKSADLSSRQDGFPSTRWSLVAIAGVDDDLAAARALNELLDLYYPAMRLYLTRFLKLPSEQADDLLHDFLMDKVLGRQLLNKADRDKGLFRSLLRKSLFNYLNERRRRSKALKRAPNQEGNLNLDECPELAADKASSGIEFDRIWARRILNNALSNMKSECENSSRPELWEIFQARILNPILGEGPAMSYTELVERFEFLSPEQASNLLVTAKRMFQRNLREVIRDTVNSDDDLDEEISDLKKILSNSRAGSL